MFEVAVDEHLFDILQAIDQALPQHADALDLGAHFLAGDPKGLAHADDLRGSVPERMPRSCPPPCICASRRTRGLRRTYSADALGP